MKRLVLSLLACSLLLTGCFETTVEININQDGTGTISTTSDMSSISGMLKQMGDNEQITSLKNARTDTLVSLASQADSIAGLTDREKELLKTGSMRMVMDLSGERMF